MSANAAIETFEPSPESAERPSVASLARSYLEAHERARRSAEEMNAIGVELLSAMASAEQSSIEPIEGVRIAVVIAAPRKTLDRARCELTIHSLSEALNEAGRIMAEHGIAYAPPPIASGLPLKSSKAPSPFLTVRFGVRSPATIEASYPL